MKVFLLKLDLNDIYANGSTYVMFGNMASNVRSQFIKVFFSIGIELAKRFGVVNFKDGFGLTRGTFNNVKQINSGFIVRAFFLVTNVFKVLRGQLFWSFWFDFFYFWLRFFDFTLLFLNELFFLIFFKRFFFSLANKKGFIFFFVPSVC